MLDAVSLEYFAVVSREQSVNRAARILHASQPAISRRIQQLEEEFGAPLFERRPGGMVLTRAGLALARYVEEIRRLTDEATHVVRTVAGRAENAVRIGFTQPTLIVLVPLLRLLQIQHPEIAVEPIELDRTELLERVRQDQIDLALPGYVQAGLLPEFDGLRVPSPPIAYLLTENHRFAHRRRLRLAELKDEKFVSMDDREFLGFTSLLSERCRMAGFTPNILVYAHTWPELIAHVTAGHGIAFAPQSVIALPLTSSIKMIHADIRADWYALWNPSNGNPQLRTIIQLVLDTAPLRWASMKRTLPDLGLSRIHSTPKPDSEKSSGKKRHSNPPH